MHTAGSSLYGGLPDREPPFPDRDPPPGQRPPWTETPGRNMGPETETPRRNMGPGSLTGSDIIQRPPPNAQWKEWQTCAKTLPSPKLRFQVVTRRCGLELWVKTSMNPVMNPPVETDEKLEKNIRYSSLRPSFHSLWLISYNKYIAIAIEPCEQPFTV